MAVEVFELCPGAVPLLPRQPHENHAARGQVAAIALIIIRVKYSLVRLTFVPRKMPSAAVARRRLFASDSVLSLSSGAVVFNRHGSASFLVIAEGELERSPKV